LPVSRSAAQMCQERHDEVRYSQHVRALVLGFKVVKLAAAEAVKQALSDAMVLVFIKKRITTYFLSL
jgi:hypothetical protein